MIDPANATNIAITGRLRAAGLLPLAERVAKREELLLHHVIALGSDPTGGHVALWRALAAEGQSATQLSALLGWPAAVIEASLGRPAPRLVAPIPEPPKSGERAVRSPRKRAYSAKSIAAVIEAAVAPLRQQIRGLTITVGVLTARIGRTDRGVPISQIETVLAEVTAKHGISVRSLLGKRRDAIRVNARREVVMRLTSEIGMSSVEIARVLKRESSTIRDYIDRAAKEAA